LLAAKITDALRMYEFSQISD